MDKNKLHTFFAGKASIDEGMEIKAWMESSKENERAFYKERKLFDALLLSNDRIKADSYLKTLPKRRIRKIEWVKIAAVIVLTLTLNYVYQAYKVSLEPLAMNTITVPAGQRVNIVLPDGTDVWLNARTTFQYPANFKGQKRKVVLKGEAYFEVAKNEKQPFVVQTEKYDVEVLGTKFDVDAYPGQEIFETTLMQGSVKVGPAAAPEHTVTLKPGQKVYLKDGQLHVTRVKDYNPYRWKEGLICFKDDSFRNIMEDFEKYYGIRIIINNQEVLKYSYTGKFRQADGVDYALRVLQKSIRFKYEKDNDKQIIYIN